MIPANQAQQIGEKEGLDLKGVMLHLLHQAKQKAVVPVSNFPVGAVAAGPPIGDWANLYLGANMEFAGLPVTFSIHAEQSAVNNLWLSGENEIQALACTSPPCGHCRQFLTEIGRDFTVVTPRGSHLLSALLPFPFGPADLGKVGGLLQPNHHPLEFVEPTDDPLALSALTAASQSYAPYTGAYSGCALETESGEIVAGRYAENVAFNPTLTALHSAFAQSAGKKIKRIVIATTADDSIAALLQRSHTPSSVLSVLIVRNAR